MQRDEYIQSTSLLSVKPILGNPDGHELSVRAELLERGGPELWDRFMDELREQHLGIRRAPGTPSVFAELRAAHDAAVEGSDR